MPSQSRAVHQPAATERKGPSCQHEDVHIYVWIGNRDRWDVLTVCKHFQRTILVYQSNG